MLLLPYETLTLDRGNHIVNLVEELEERFPKLLDPYASVNPRFFILVSKWTNDVRDKDTMH